MLLVAQVNYLGTENDSSATDHVTALNTNDKGEYQGWSLAANVET